MGLCGGSRVKAEEIPTWEQDGIQFKLVAGEAFNRKSAVPVYSKLYMLEIKSQARQHVALGEHLYGESGLYILEGGVETDCNDYGPKQMLVTKESHLCEFTIQGNSTIYIFGGEPFPEERFIDWNFVASDKALIAAAKHRWIDHEFEKIIGEETEFVPYPNILKQ